MSTLGLVLAAGNGSRYRGETHKLLAPFHGRPLVLAVLEAALAAGFDAVAAVTGAVDLSAVAPPGIVLLDNPNWSVGLARSLQVGLSWCATEGFEAAVIGLGDAPRIPASAWRALRMSEAEVAVASFSGRLHPPVRLAASRFAEVPDTGDVGARALWQRGGAVVECEGDPFDVDTAEDLAVLEARQ